MNTEELNALKEKAHKWAVEHGFHEDVKPDAFYLGLVMSEAGEAINADRKGLHADTKRFEEVMEMRSISPRAAFEENIKGSVEDEIADIVIRLLDFSGLKGYTLLISWYSASPSIAVVDEFAGNGLSGTLFALIGALSDSLDNDTTETTVGIVINIFIDCFKNMTGSDKDLWWFVERKMKYNEQRPMLNGKKY